MPKKSRGAYLKWRKDKKAWYIYEYKNGERCRSTGTDDLDAAKRELARYITESSRPDCLLPPSDRKVADALADYAEERGKFLKSQKTFWDCYDKLLDYWGKKCVADVTESSCRDYYGDRDTRFKRWLKEKKQPPRTIAPSVVARELSVLQAALTNDWKQGRLTQYVNVWKPSFDNRKDRWLTQEEVGRLLEVAESKPRAKNYLPLFILLGVYTGARHSAILELTWDRVDLEMGLIDYNNPLKERTAKGRALTRIPSPLREALEAVTERKGFVITRAVEPLKSVKKMFAECCLEAGLEDVSPHTLRHTCASWQAQDGVAFAKIGKYLGHSSSQMTERRYSHLTPDFMDDSLHSLNNRPYTRPEKKNTKRKMQKTAVNKG